MTAVCLMAKISRDMPQVECCCCGLNHRNIHVAPCKCTNTDSARQPMQSKSLFGLLVCQDDQSSQVQELVCIHWRGSCWFWNKVVQALADAMMKGIVEGIHALESLVSHAVLLLLGCPNICSGEINLSSISQCLS